MYNCAYRLGCESFTSPPAPFLVFKGKCDPLCGTESKKTFFRKYYHMLLHQWKVEQNE